MSLKVSIINAHLCINFVITVGKMHVPKVAGFGSSNSVKVANWMIE
jgi:hypothetical protein